jgi:hypothetical protein
MRRNDQYVHSFKFILNIYIWLHSLKKIKIGFNFFTAGGGGQTITFFQTVQPTKSNGYATHKK